MSTTKSTTKAAAGPITIRLRSGDFHYFNWVLAFERPVLPFLIYSFVLFNLASLLGVWPTGRLFAMACLVSLLLFGVWTFSTTRGLWQRHPQIRQPRTYTFGDDGYRVGTLGGETSASETSVSWGDVATLLRSRRGLYLIRRDGSADVLPNAQLADPDALALYLGKHAGGARRSRFL